MNRSQRLLQLLQILRSYRYAVSGERLAERLGVSIRTLYRDIATLQQMGADIEGEVGVGYVLKPTFFLPPLMFTPSEIQSLVLGMRWVAQYGDAPLSKGAADVLNKVVDVLPATIKNSINSYALRVGPPASHALVTEDLSILRTAIADQNKISINYKSGSKKQHHYIVWPFTIGYFTDKRILVAWCEARNEFHHFQTDNIHSINVLDSNYPRSKDSLFQEWQKIQLSKLVKKYK